MTQGTQCKRPTDIYYLYTTTGAWCAVLGMFMSQSRARIVHLHSKLATSAKGSLPPVLHTTL
jgi:hypothetical protein